MGKFYILTQILQGNALFAGKIYTARKFFTRPPVATVVTNFKSVLDGTNILLNFQPFAHPWLLPWGAGCPCDWVRPWKVLTVVKIIGYGKYDFEEGNNYGNRRNINCWHQFRVPRVWPQLGHNSCHPLCCKTAHRFAQKYKDKETVWTWSLPLSM